MKKVKFRSKSRGPGAASLREMPELKLESYRVRRNPYATRIAREGIQVAHDGPSATSLAEIPEVDFKYATVRPNRYAVRAAESAARIQYGRGRPPRGTEVGTTVTRSVRLPAAIWAALETEAKQRSTTVHALLRELIIAFVTRRRGA
jgi:hypothetical protein